VFFGPHLCVSNDVVIAFCGDPSGNISLCTWAEMWSRGTRSNRQHEPHPVSGPSRSLENRLLRAGRRVALRSRNARMLYSAAL
jgi:hypothetical protein